MEKDKDTYILEVWTSSGKEYREMTREELRGFFNSNPQYILESIDNIISMCDTAEKHNADYLRMDIDCIRMEAQKLKTYLLL